jgi:hypothetical protein
LFKLHLIITIFILLLPILWILIQFLIALLRIAWVCSILGRVLGWLFSWLTSLISIQNGIRLLWDLINILYNSSLNSQLLWSITLIWFQCRWLLRPLSKIIVVGHWIEWRFHVFASSFFIVFIHVGWHLLIKIQQLIVFNLWNRWRGK